MSLDLRWNYVLFCMLDEDGDAERAVKENGSFSVSLGKLELHFRILFPIWL